MIRISALVNDDRRIAVYDAMRPTAHHNCVQIAVVVSLLFHGRPLARPPTIFMYVAIAGVETRSIERTENPAQWLIEFASRLGASAADPCFRTESFDAAEKWWARITHGTLMIADSYCVGCCSCSNLNVTDAANQLSSITLESQISITSVVI